MASHENKSFLLSKVSSQTQLSKNRLLRIKLKWANPRLFLFIFVFFTFYNCKNCWKHRWCARDSNLGRQNGRHRRIHRAMAAPLHRIELVRGKIYLLQVLIWMEFVLEILGDLLYRQSRYLAQDHLISLTKNGNGHKACRGSFQIIWCIHLFTLWHLYLWKIKMLYLQKIKLLIRNKSFFVIPKLIINTKNCFSKILC